MIFTIKLGSIRFSRSVFLRNVSILLWLFFMMVFSPIESHVSRIFVCLFGLVRSTRWKIDKLFIALSIVLLLLSTNVHTNRFSRYVVSISRREFMCTGALSWKLKVAREHRCFSLLLCEAGERVNFHWMNATNVMAVASCKYVFGFNDTQGINCVRCVFYFPPLFSFQFQLKESNEQKHEMTSAHLFA